MYQFIEKTFAKYNKTKETRYKYLIYIPLRFTSTKKEMLSSTVTLYFPLKLKLVLINSIDICNKRLKLIEKIIKRFQFYDRW